MGNSYTDDAYKELIYKHKDWQRTADEYEQKFAANLYKTNYVQAAARTALTKLSGMLTSYYSVKDNRQRIDQGDLTAFTDIAETISGQKTEGRQVLEEALLPGENRDSSSGAGQIGNARYRARQAGQDSPEALAAASEQNLQNIDQVINGDGNLREQMTMLYNGMFINGGHTREQIAGSHSLKNMLLNITPEELSYMQQAGRQAGDEDMANANVRFDLLNEMDQYKAGKDVFDTYSMSRDLKKGADKVKGRGNPISRWFSSVKRRFSSSFMSKFIRSARRPEDRKGLGLEHYEGLGIGLSDRERLNAVGEDGKLKWLEGQAYFSVKTPVTAEGLLQTAGPSGTTLRMLGAYKLIGASKQELLYFRLALIAWMVTSKDHSLFEILKGSHNAGVKGYEDLSEAANMYKTVDPIPEQEIRNQLAPDKRYPHETIYLQMLNELRDKRKAQNPNPTARSGVLFKPSFVQGQVSDEEKYDAMSYDAQDLATNVYTTELYKLMNLSQKYGSFIGRRLMGMIGVREAYNSRDLGNDEIKEGIFNLARLSSRMVMDGLEEHSATESARETIDQADLRSFSYKSTTLGTDQETQEDRDALAASKAYKESFTGGGRRAYRGLAFRGGTVESKFKSAGNTISFSNLTSTAMALSVAANFYKDGTAARDKKTIVKLKMTGKGAVSVMDVSQFSGESEVLVSPGSKFKVTRALGPAYLETQFKEIRFPEEVPEDDLKHNLVKRMPGISNGEEQEDSVPYYLQEDGSKTPGVSQYRWARVQVVELEEVSGPGEERRRRMEGKRAKKDEVRQRLLAARRASAAAQPA